MSRFSSVDSFATALATLPDGFARSCISGRSDGIFHELTIAKSDNGALYSYGIKPPKGVAA